MGLDDFLSEEKKEEKAEDERRFIQKGEDLYEAIQKFYKDETDS